MFASRTGTRPEIDQPGDDRGSAVIGRACLPARVVCLPCGVVLRPLDRAADRAAVHPVEKSQELLRDVTAIVEQQVVFEAADLARAAGLRLTAFGRVPRAAQSRQHLIEGRDADAGEAVETGAAAQPGGGEQGCQGDGSFATKESYESYCPVVWESPFSARMRQGRRRLSQQV